jgi:putative transposase
MAEVIVSPDDLRLWRFSIISPLLHKPADGASLHAQIEEVSKRVYYTPSGKEKLISADTIRDWLKRYRSVGIDGLCQKVRKNQGQTLVPETLQQALIDLRKNQPQWTVKRLLRSLQEQGGWNGRKPSRSALYRFTKAHDLNRNLKQPSSPVRSFEFPFFGDLWTADFLHGPKVSKGTYRYKTYLLAIIDDATRYIVAARFYYAEDIRSFLDALMLSIRRFGIPKRLYTDNGAAFHSRHLRLVAAKLSISLPHTPPYTPMGRGKIERFFRSVRDGFLTGKNCTTIEKLNADLAVWIELYHHTIHSMLEMSPLDRKLSDTEPLLKQIPPTQDIDDIFRIEQLCRVGSDGCVRIFKKRFEVPDALPKSIVTIYYLPWNQNCIFLGPQRKILTPLNTIKNALRFDKPRRGNPQQNNQNKETNE